jgi:hypothetical protein
MVLFFTELRIRLSFVKNLDFGGEVDPHQPPPPLGTPLYKTIQTEHHSRAQRVLI